MRIIMDWCNRVLVLGIVSVVIVPFTNTHHTTTMEEAQIIPDLIDVIGPVKLQVNYFDSNVAPNWGNELTPTQVQNQPNVSWTADPNTHYTLIMADPDAPSRAEPKFRAVCHWTVVNIAGTDINNGDTVFDYVGSGPPKGTGLHRYVFLLFKQPDGKILVGEEHVSNTSRKNRLGWSVRAFARKYNLGNPIGGNFYVAQYDEFVPILHSRYTS